MNLKQNGLLLAAVFTLIAASSDGTSTIAGQGLISCRTWTAQRKNNRAFGAEAWVLGFLSGVGAAVEGDDPLARTDVKGVFAWIDNYCGTHPIEELSDATKAFYRAHPHP